MSLRVGLCPLLTESITSCLRQKGVRTVTDFVVQDVEMLSQKSGISYKELLALRRVLLAQFSSFPVSGTDLYQIAVTSTSILSSGCTCVDELLDGGLYTGEITEIAGEIAAGKTQFCMSCAVSVMACTKQNVLYIDTGASCCGERMLEIAEHSGHDVDEATFQNIRCCQVFDMFSLLSVLEEIKSHLLLQTDVFYGNLKLVIVDNVASVIYPILGGQQMDGHGLMVSLSLKLKQLASDFSIAILITNNVTGPAGDRKAGLGKTWSHVPHTRLLISPVGGELSTVRHLTIVKSTKLATGRKVQCQIGTRGIQNMGTESGDRG